MLKHELDYFVANQSDLVSKYNGKVLVIRDQAVVGIYESPLEAYLKAQEEYQLGTFLIQTCVPGPAAYTASISSQAIIL